MMRFLPFFFRCCRNSGLIPLLLFFLAALAVGLPLSALAARAAQRLPAVEPNALSTFDASRLPAKMQVMAAVPDLTGLTREQAAAILAKAGLALGAVSEKPAPVDREGVVGQKPAAGEWVTAGTGVAVTLAVPDLVTVPDLFGLNRARALTTLEKFRLGQGPVRETSSSRTAGTVVGQRPSADARVVAGTPVTLTLAAVGARKEDRPEGTSVDQRPAAGTSVPPWSPVAFTVAVPRLVEVLDLSGLERSRAEAVLRTLGLVPGETRQRPSPRPQHTVIGQEPSSGTRVDPGTVVQMVVAVAEMIEVPDVLGRTVEQAGGILAGVGLRLGAITRREATEADGLVIAQRPRPEPPC